MAEMPKWMDFYLIGNKSKVGKVGLGGNLLYINASPS